MKSQARAIPTTLLALLTTLFAGPAVAQGVGNPPPTLSDRGFPGSTLAKTVGTAAIYRLGRSGSSYYFAVVRPLQPNEAVVDYVDGVNEFASPIAQYGPATSRRFTEHIIPLLDSPGNVVTAYVYHYAAGVSLQRVPNLAIRYSEERHFATGQPIETPLAKEDWTGERRNSSMPFVWKGRGENRDQVAPFNTLAALQGAHSEGAARQQAGAAQRDALYRAEAKALEARRAEVQAREADRRRLITAAGLRFLAQETWDGYRLGPELKAIFDGSWPDAAREWEFGAIYLRTIQEYSDRCRYLIPPDSPSRTTYIINTDEFGRQSKSAQHTTFIPRAFVAPFEWWDKRSPEALPLTPPGYGEASVEDAMKTLATVFANPLAALTAVRLIARVEFALREDMATLFKGGCESTELKQFMENMRRLALRIPTVQAQLAPRSILSGADWPMSIGQACQRHDKERGSTSSARTCACLEREANARMTLGERWRAVADYHTFFDEVYGIRTGPDGRPIPERDAVAGACRP